MLSVLLFLLFCFCSTRSVLAFPIMTTAPSQTVATTTSLSYYIAYESENQTENDKNRFTSKVADLNDFEKTENKEDKSVTDLTVNSSGYSTTVIDLATITDFKINTNDAQHFDYNKQINLEIQNKLFGFNFGIGQRNNTPKYTSSSSKEKPFGTTVDIEEIMRYENFLKILPELKQVLVTKSV